MSVGYDLRPDGPPIAAIRAKRMSWGVAFAELVDNSFDADARRVEIALEKNGFSVRDDGSGLADLTPLFKLGEHRGSASTKSGRYGIGAKDVIYRGDRISVLSVSGGFTRRLTVDVLTMLERESKIDGEDPEPTDEPSGTLIRVDHIPHELAEIRQHDIRTYLSKSFTPALLSGRQILLGMASKHLEPVSAWQAPLLKHVIETEHDFGDGRSFTLRAGLLADPKSDGRGTFIAYAHRYLDESKLGLEESPAARVHAAVSLHETRRKLWRLEEHKRELLERHREQLAEALAPLLHPLIEADLEEHRDLRIDGANCILNLALGQEGGTSTPRPGKGSTEGGVFGKDRKAEPPAPPKSKPKPPLEASEKTRRPLSRGIRVRTEPLGEEGDPFQYAQSGKSAEIVFNRDHVLWRQIGQDEIQIAREAMFIYTHSRAETKQQRLLFGLTEDNLKARAAEFGLILRASSREGGPEVS